MQNIIETSSGPFKPIRPGALDPGEFPEGKVPKTCPRGLFPDPSMGKKQKVSGIKKLVLRKVL